MSSPTQPFPLYVFRTLWGVPPSSWGYFLPTLKQRGYDGVEVNLVDIPSPAEFKTLLETNGLKVVIMIFSHWDNYAGPRPDGWGVKEHLGKYREGVRGALEFGPVRINSHSGGDYFTPAEALEFFEGTLVTDKELGAGGLVAHETHRSRALFNPFITDWLLSQPSLSTLRTNADFSHWTVVCERLLTSSPSDLAILQRIIPHVTHIHARTGSAQAPQIPDTALPQFADELESHTALWRLVWQHQKMEGRLKEATVTTEYGPWPYHPYGAPREFGEVADGEVGRLRRVFEEVQ